MTSTSTKLSSTETNQEAGSDLNGINPRALSDLINTVKSNPEQGETSWGVSTVWQGGCVTDTHVIGCRIGGKACPKDYNIRIDEPLELGGTNTQPNPQEHLLAALNACMTVGYVALATLYGIKLDSLEIKSKGDIDLHGFFGLDSETKPGYDAIDYEVHIKGDGTPEQFKEIHKTVMKTSPNRFNLANPITLNPKLVVG